MLELVHVCGKKLRFPEGSEGKKGKCPSCGRPVLVPRVSPAQAPADTAAPVGAPVSTSPAPPVGAPEEKKRAGLAPAPRPRPSGEGRLELDPPPNWAEYQAFLDGRGPAPRSFVMPANLMLKTDADERWTRAEAIGPPSKYNCPGCKKTLHVGDLVCLGCGVDLRIGRTLDGEKKLSEAGLQDLQKIPWLKDAAPADEGSDASDPKKTPGSGPSRKRIKRRPR